MSNTTTTQTTSPAAAEVAALTRAGDQLAKLYVRDDKAILTKAVALHRMGLPKSEGGLGLSLSKVAVYASKARARLAYPLASADEVDMLADDGAFRIAPSTVNSYAKAVANVVGLSLVPDEATVILAKNLITRTGSNEWLAGFTSRAAVSLTDLTARREAFLAEGAEWYKGWRAAQAAAASAPVESAPVESDDETETAPASLIDSVAVGISPEGIVSMLANIDPAAFTQAENSAIWDAAEFLLERLAEHAAAPVAVATHATL